MELYKLNVCFVSQVRFLIFLGSSKLYSWKLKSGFSCAERRFDKIREATNRGSAKVEHKVSETMKTDVREVITVQD